MTIREISEPRQLSEGDIVRINDRVEYEVIEVGPDVSNVAGLDYAARLDGDGRNVLIYNPNSEVDTSAPTMILTSGRTTWGSGVRTAEIVEQKQEQGGDA